MKLLRPLAGYTLYDHKTNDYLRRELQITGILDKIDEYRLYSYAPHNDVSVNDGPHIRRWSHKIII